MNVRFFEYRIPFTHPIRIGETLQSARKGLYLRLEDEEGIFGWGEVAPLDGYGPDTFVEVSELIAGPVDSYSPSLRFGLDCAKREIQAQKQGISFRDTFGPSVRSVIESAQLVSEATQARFVKTKVGGVSVRDDVNRVAKILSTLPIDGKLRLDANGVWSKSEAMEFADTLLRASSSALTQIEFIEEPWRGCFDGSHPETYPIPIGIDESFDRNSESWLQADVVLIKPALFGAILEFLEVKKEVEIAGKRLVMASAFETHLGMSALVALASSFEGGAEGLGTYRYLRFGPKEGTQSRDDHSDPVALPPEASAFNWLFSAPIDSKNLLPIPGHSLEAHQLPEVTRQ
ncbi:MAG: hypothetical protein O3B41_00465 [Bacteroidetes bacterium]|nr:hypothetical protein [Bacteroidota bacterium]